MSPVRACPKHNKPYPCGPCRIESAQRPAQKAADVKPTQTAADVKQVAQDWFVHQYFEQNNTRRPEDVLRKEWKTVAESTGIRPDQKCVHGVYLHEFYCGFCAWKIIDPDYDPEIYRVEINKALANAKFILKNGKHFVNRTTATAGPYLGDAKAEGQKDFEDLTQLVDVEIWKATKRYGDKMTAALAYTVAKNQSGRFLADRIEEQTLLVTDSDGNPVLDEFGQEAGLTGAELKQKSEDASATPEERQEAKKLLERYAQRIPRFSSFDDKPEDDKGEDSEVSSAEREVIHLGAGDAEDWREAHIPALHQLISTWHGKKRRVAEAMLQPGFTVRSVPGLDKSKVSRIYQVVLRSFKALITQDLQNK